MQTVILDLIQGINVFLKFFNLNFVLIKLDLIKVLLYPIESLLYSVPVSQCPMSYRSILTYAQISFKSAGVTFGPEALHSIFFLISQHY